MVLTIVCPNIHVCKIIVSCISNKFDISGFDLSMARILQAADQSTMLFLYSNCSLKFVLKDKK